MVIFKAQLENTHSSKHIFARLAPICSYAQAVLSNKISASELSRKFIKSAFLVGKAQKSTKNISFFPPVLQVSGKKSNRLH